MVGKEARTYATVKKVSTSFVLHDGLVVRCGDVSDVDIRWETGLGQLLSRATVPLHDLIDHVHRFVQLVDGRQLKRRPDDQGWADGTELVRSGLGDLPSLGFRELLGGEVPHVGVDGPGIVR
jgi:hypothetical protein